MSKLVPYDPFAEMQALQKQFFGDDFLAPIASVQMPMADVYTEDNKLIIEAHLPNFHEDDVNISLENGVLEIQAERHEKEENKKKKKYVVRETSSSFYRRIHLPDRADGEHIDAHMKNGILTVSVPLKELPEPKKIAVRSSK